MNIHARPVDTFCCDYFVYMNEAHIFVQSASHKLHVSGKLNSRLNQMRSQRKQKYKFPDSWKYNLNQIRSQLTSLVNEVTLKKNYSYLTSLKIDLGIEVAVEGRVDKLQDVTQFLKLPLHPSLHKVFITTQVSAQS